MQRRWQVQPDETGTISREALIGAMIDGAVMLDIAGGVLNIVVGRAPTNLQGEMVMTGAVLQWQDRTDAKAQAETPVAVTAPTEPINLRQDGRDRIADAKGEVERALLLGEPETPVAPEQETAPTDAATVDTDGFDYSKLEDEDIEPAPELAR